MKTQIKKGKTEVSLYVFIQDSASSTGAGKTGLAYNTAGLSAYYVRPLAAAASIPLVTLALVTTAWASGGFIEVDSVNMPGVYRLDVPNAVFATGVDSVVMMMRGASGMAPLVMEVMLIAYDPQDTVRLGLTALPNVAAGANGGLPTGNASGQVVVSSTATGAITSGSFAAGAINNAAIATDAIGSDELAASAITEIQSGLATSAALATVAGYIDTEVAAIKTNTDLLPTNFSAVTSAIGALNDFNPATDTVAHVTLVDTTTTNTDMRGTDNAFLATDGAALQADVDAISTAEENAEALLKYDMSTITGEAGRSPLNALRVLRNKISTSESVGKFVVKKEDDSTTAWEGILSTDASAVPITGVDPT